MNSQQIPSNFVLGAATAAFQIEGGADRGPSIWDTFCRVPGAVLDGDDGQVACDHYHRYREDVALMKQMGLDSYRFSTSWARIFPDGRRLNQAGLDFYSRLVDELLEAEIKPWLTLYHWDLPQALEDEGGWPSRDTAERFRDYALTVHRALGDRVDTWTTLNEPWCSSFLSYTAGAHAPGHQDLGEGMLASHHLLLGHGWATQALREANSSLELGLTLNLTPVQPLTSADKAVAEIVDGQANRWFLDPLFRGRYPADIVQEYRRVDEAAADRFTAAVRPGDLEAISTPIDVLGINYYQGDIVTAQPQLPAELAEKFGEFPLPPRGDAPVSRPVSAPTPSATPIYRPDTSLPRTAMGWQVDPLLLTELLQRVHEEYTGPAGVHLYVTENGAAFTDVVTDGQIHDQDRANYLQWHLGAVLDAQRLGVDVRGYFYWSFLDNFEWAWGYSQRFGIVYVNYETQERIVKDSGRLYAEIIATRKLDVEPNTGRVIRRGTLVE